MHQKHRTTLLFSFIAILTRLIPHPYSMTSTLTSSVFNGIHLKRWHALTLTLLGFAITDMILAFTQHHAAFGGWSLWTYSGLALITLLSTKAPTDRPLTLGFTVLCFGLVYWLWTNLGCFFTMPEYPKNFYGLIHCYSLALPFLKNQLMGNTLWTLVLIYSHKTVNKNLNHTALAKA
jgi:hypothetical protein